VMTRIGAVCLITILVWIIIELPVQFAGYRHGCRLGVCECTWGLWVARVFMGVRINRNLKN
jgi:hypothetical protein